MKNQILKLFVLPLFALSLFVACEDDDNVDPQSGSLQMEMTDAPIDNAEIQGVFVTVAQVKLDGVIYENFSGKQTINLLAYQNGETTLLGLSDVEAKSYNRISLVLDYEQDANGNAPGCYVLTTDNTKHNLNTSSSSMQEITLESSDFEVEEGSQKNLVIDFDLRKAIKEGNSNNAQSNYSFVTALELNSAVRKADKDKSGMVKGTCNDDPSMNNSRVVAFAYAKGTYNESTETQGQGESNIRFKNAVSSGVVADNGEYTIAFLEEGEYEIHFASYEDSNNDGKLEFKGMLEVNGLISLNNVNVSAQSQTTLNVNITGLIP